MPRREAVAASQVVTVTLMPGNPIDTRNATPVVHEIEAGTERR